MFSIAVSRVPQSSDLRFHPSTGSRYVPSRSVCRESPVGTHLVPVRAVCGPPWPRPLTNRVAHSCRKRLRLEKTRPGALSRVRRRGACARCLFRRHGCPIRVAAAFPGAAVRDIKTVLERVWPGRYRGQPDDTRTTTARARTVEGSRRHSYSAGAFLSWRGSGDVALPGGAATRRVP